MRIITGQYKGRQLKAPGGIRPTEDRIRKSLFDIIDPEGQSFLELFAGSGSVGFEALSQGASGVLFVEKERGNVKVIEENARLLTGGDAGKASRIEVLTGDALSIVPFLARKGRKFDLIFLDPPYYMGTSEKMLQLLGEYDILFCSGTIIVQHFKKDAVSERAGGLEAFRKSKYGDSILTFYRKEQHEREGDLPGHV